jgi:hypothetical protein
MINGTTLTFKRKVEAGTDGMNNPVFNTEDVDVADCLVAPIVPSAAAEQQAMTQTRGQIEIHLPKVFTGDVGGSTVDWDGDTYRVDNDGAKFMTENTPGRWNRFFRAEVIRG